MKLITRISMVRKYEKKSIIDKKKVLDNNNSL